MGFVPLCFLCLSWGCVLHAGVSWIVMSLWSFAPAYASPFHLIPLFPQPLPGGITQTSGDGTPLSPPQIPLESLLDILSWVTQSGVCTLSGPSSYIHTLAEW